jgi:hypothetical protein
MNEFEEQKQNWIENLKTKNINVHIFYDLKDQSITLSLIKEDRFPQARNKCLVP